MSINLSMSLDGGHSRSAHIQKNKPSARDGHSSFVFHDKMFIFGGDRHHMPFNDLFFLDIDIWFKSIETEWMTILYSDICLISLLYNTETQWLKLKFIRS